MSFDPSSLPAAAQARYIAVGAQFPSTRTLAQGRRTGLALGRHGKVVGRFGFPEADGERLKDSLELLTRAGVAREQARTGRKRGSLAFRRACREGSAARIQARAVLRALLGKAEELGLQERQPDIETVLGRTASEPDDGEPLATQLELLQKLLEDKALVPVVKGRGGPEAVAALKAAVQAVRTADQARPRTLTTPTETRQLDLLDGIIVDLVRSAYQAARAAARALGQPGLEEEFAVTELYGRRRSAQPGEPEPPNDDDADDDDDTDDDAGGGPAGPAAGGR